MRVLIIEDDEQTRKALEAHLTSESYTVDTADNGETGSYIARTNDYDLILLDNMLPKKMGLDVCKDIRNAGKKTPIILVSVVSDIQEKVALLESGADDYLTKPFSFSELHARMKALLRRPYTISEEVITLDDLTVDVSRHTVKKGEKNVYLTRKEFMLLECLMKNGGQVVSRAQIMEQVWNYDSDPFSNTIEAHVRNLRKKLDKGKKKLIHTVSGRGYKLDRQK
ncbi:MAG: hypothetical protein RL094_643 [Candidatus Parcubacteria bacterium]|jgi:DNA-binding response OmpR family regulator